MLTETYSSNTDSIGRHLLFVQLPELLFPLKKLLYHYAGIEEYLESEDYYPHKQLTMLLTNFTTVSAAGPNEALSASADVSTLTRAIKLISTARLFNYHAHSKCKELKVWQPLEQTFAQFTREGSRSVVVWEDERYRLPAQAIARWLLKNSMRIVR